jgi:hypothetical protein
MWNCGERPYQRLPSAAAWWRIEGTEPHNLSSLCVANPLWGETIRVGVEVAKSTNSAICDRIWRKSAVPIFHHRLRVPSHKPLWQLLKGASTNAAGEPLGHKIFYQV